MHSLSRAVLPFIQFPTPIPNNVENRTLASKKPFASTVGVMTPSNTGSVQMDTPAGREIQATFQSTSDMIDLSMSRLLSSTMQIVPCACSNSSSRPKNIIFLLQVYEGYSTIFLDSNQLQVTPNSFLQIGEIKSFTKQFHLFAFLRIGEKCGFPLSRVSQRASPKSGAASTASSAPVSR